MKFEYIVRLIDGKSLRGSRLYAEQLLAKTRDTASRHGG